MEDYRKKLSRNRYLAAIFTGAGLLFAPTMIYADHQYTGWRWDSSDIPIVARHSITLQNLNIDGSTGQFSLAKSLLEEGYEKWNAVGTEFQVVSGSTGNNLNSASSIDGQGGTLAIANCPVDGQTLRIIQCTTVYDTGEPWSSNEAEDFKPILQYVATHEYGHWVSFWDIYEQPFNPPTTMVGWYVKSLNQAVQQHDSWALEDAYP